MTAPSRDPRSSGRSTAVAVGAIALVALGIYGYRGFQRAEAVERTAKAWGRAAHCLVGPPLRQGELASARLRNIELARDARADAGWPRRCASYLRETVRALEPLARVAPFEDARDELSRASIVLARGELPNDVNALFRTIALAGIRTLDDASVPSPPTPATPMADRALARIAPRPVTGPIADGAPAGDLRLLFVGAPALGCVLASGARPEDGLSEARCRDLPDVPARGVMFTIAGAEDGAPLWALVRARDAAHLYGPDGRERRHAPTMHAFVRRDGTAAALSTDASGPTLVELGEHGEATPVALERPEGGAPFQPVLAYDHVVWITHTSGPPVDDDDDEEIDEHAGRPVVRSRVHVRALPSRAGGPLGPEQIAGEVESQLADIRACRTPDATVLVIDGPEAHGRVPQHVFFGDDAGTWHAHVTGNAAIAAHILTCRGREVAMTWVQAAASRTTGSYRVMQLRCTPAGCTSAEAEVTGAGTDPLVADLDGRVVLVGRDPRDRVTRVRVAPIGELARAPSRAVIDDRAHGGVDAIAQSLHVRRGVAVLVMRTPTDVRALRIDATGAIRSVAASSTGASAILPTGASAR